MSSYETVITNKALAKMHEHGLYEADILDAFNNGQTEDSTWGGRWNAVRKYSAGYEIGVNYDRDPDGKWIIISCWKRARR